MMPFSTIYKFMWKDQGLHSAEKEFFAVIYGFWRRSKAPVEIPIRTVTEITGLSRTSVIMAKRGLLKKELAAAQEICGKPTHYEVLIPDPLENRTGAENAFRAEKGGVMHRMPFPYRRSLFFAPNAFDDASRTPGGLFAHRAHIPYHRWPSPVPNANHPTT